MNFVLRLILICCLRLLSCCLLVLLVVVGVVVVGCYLVDVDLVDWVDRVDIYWFILVFSVGCFYCCC